MVRPTKFEIRQSAEGAGLRLSLDGELDMRTIAQLSERVTAAVAAGAGALTLDLRDLAFMDSTGLRLLIELNDSSRAEGWRLRLIAPEHEAAALVLRATGADRALPFVETGEA